MRIEHRCKSKMNARILAVLSFLHKSEIRKLIGKTKEQGYTLIPLRVYEKNGLVKVEIALAKGKNLYDKRETLKKRDDLRNMQRAMRR